MKRLKRLTVIFSDNLRLRCLFDGDHSSALSLARKIARDRGTYIRRFACINT